MTRIRQYIRTVFIVVAIVAFTWYISTYCWQIALVQGESMYPTYHEWQFIILDKKADKFEKGDVIAFQCETLDTVMIKRIVAVSGDTVCISDGNLYVNGASPVNTNISYSGIAGQKLTIPKGKCFVMGDNYEYSKDSRYEEIGYIDFTSIIGIVYPNK